jgi:hypothetical protein
MVHLGDESNDIWHSWFDGTDWAQNVRIEGQASKATPALAAFGNQLHMVHLGDSSDQIWHSAFDGTNWSPNAPVYYHFSKLAPSLASFAGRLHMVHRGNDLTRIWYSQFEMGRWTVKVRVPNQSTKASPAIASFAGRLYMVHLGHTSNYIWYTSSDGILSVIRIGFKFVVPPITDINIILAQARVIFGRVGFNIEEAAPRETLTVAVDLRDIDVDDCILGKSTIEQNELFTFRNNLGPRDIAVYIVDSVLDPANTLAGCASHPDAVPACLIEANASAVLMAHEIGHVLGLHHVSDTNNIMWNKGGWTNLPPDLTLGQALTVQNSRYSRE